jgi:hypothetical protein
MAGDRATTTNEVQSTRASRRQISDEPSRTGALDELRSALLDAVGGDWSAAAIDRPQSHSSREFDALRRAVARFVVLHRADRSPPERVLIELKEALALTGRAPGREPEREIVRAVILHAFLSSYFEHAWL